MHSTHLHEHDANQGAKSSGEFLGMTGNSGWYLLASGGVTILMVIFLWGILGVSLLLCLLTGVVLCGLSVAYVFALKNNRPEHYDTDLFESALIESGILPLRFGPRDRRPANPFGTAGAELSPAPVAARTAEHRSPATAHSLDGGSSITTRSEATPAVATEKGHPARERKEQMVPRVVYERLSDRLATAEELLEDVLAERGEDLPCA